MAFYVEMKDVDVKYIVGDELRISQILVNFLSNAQKFTEKGEIRVTFRQLQKENGKVSLMFRVHDTGKGMDAKLSAVFSSLLNRKARISPNSTVDPVLVCLLQTIWSI